MKINTSYKVKIKEFNHIFEKTAALYRDAVVFYMDVFLREWDDVFCDVSSSTKTVNAAERLTVATKHRPTVKYDFSRALYKFPCYLRRAAIAEAFGKVSSYKSNLKNWEAEDPRERGRMPSAPRVGHIFPALYRDNCYVRMNYHTHAINVWRWYLYRRSNAFFGVTERTLVVRQQAGSRGLYPGYQPVTFGFVQVAEADDFQVRKYLF